jgi:hypothetical protein
MRQDEWYVCLQAHELAVPADGRAPIPDGTAKKDLSFPCCFRDRSEIRPRTVRSSAAGAYMRNGRLGERGPGDPGRDARGGGRRSGRLRGGGQLVHIYGLGRFYGQDGAAARLLPLSVDGPIMAASLVLLHEVRNGRRAPGPGPSTPGHRGATALGKKQTTDPKPGTSTISNRTFRNAERLRLVTYR